MPKKRLLFAIDPSSTCLGFAAGWLGSDVVSKPVEMLASGKFGVSRRGSNLDRIDSIVETLKKMLEAFSQGMEVKLEIVVEMPSGKVNHRRHGGSGSGLSIYGAAAGAVREMCRNLPCVETISSTTEGWIGGHTKAKRKAVAKTYQPEYEADKDKGGDESDAICLLVWRCRQILKEEAA